MSFAFSGRLDTVTSPNSTANAVDAPHHILQPLRRPDLITRKQRERFTTVWFVKDPITLRYFRFAETEFQLFELLDGQRSPNQLCHEIQKRFPDRTFSVQDVKRIIDRWRSAGLLLDEGRVTLRRVADQKSRREQWRWLTSLSQILYWKVHAFDPDPILNRLYPWTHWIFEPTGLLIALTLVLTAIGLVIGQFDRFASQPELLSVHAFFTFNNLVWFWMTVGVIKVLHEFGHGLACKHFGGECRAMGLLFMVFTPSLYCDVSDAWMIAGKWRRIAIAAAGVYIELVIAALATFVWWFTSPGVIHSIAFAAMLFGSVQTILINANPLMRFDGYYAFSDFLEVPNLREKSQALFRHHVAKWFLGHNEPTPVTQSEKSLWLLMYALAATVYGWLVTATMIWFLTRFLEPYKLAPFGWMLAAIAIVNIVVTPLISVLSQSRFRSQPASSRSWWRPVVSFSLVLTLLAVIMFVPLPRRISAVMSVEPIRVEKVAVTVRGRVVKSHAFEGGRVKKDDLLLILESDELKLQSERLRGKRELLSTRLRTSEATLDAAASAEIRTALAELDALISLHEERMAGLIVRAPCDGILFNWYSETSGENRSGTHGAISLSNKLLDEELIGTMLDVGQIICQIASCDSATSNSSSELEAVAYLTQSQIDTIQVGQQATVFLEGIPSARINASVRDVSASGILTVPLQLTARSGGSLPIIPFGPNAGQLTEPHHAVRLSLNEGDVSRLHETRSLSGQRTLSPEATTPLLFGMRGHAAIHVASQTLSARLWHWVCTALAFR